ncbi:MAG: site-2 protease family protein [Patescibacteria group bacterium]|nr:site-2 protease family protein [Patescibacteria group bacterium]
MNLFFFFFIIIPSAVIHEYFHAWSADKLGDSTAKEAGRLTLNPLAHIDPFGTILIPLFLFIYTHGRFLFAYAKPVPFNPYLLKNQKYGPGIVAVAGPLANLALAIIFGLMVRFLPLNSFTHFLSMITFANIFLAVFNLVPIPPLDGSRILFSLLPTYFKRYERILERMGLFLILIFVFFGLPLIFAIVSFTFKLIIGRPLLLWG